MIDLTHPSDAHLGAYAAGSITSGMGLLIASHLTFCPACRDKAARLETIGGAFLRGEAAPDVTPPVLEAVLARLDLGPPIRRAEEEADPLLPLPLRRALGRRSDEIRWRTLLPGLADCAMAGDAGEDVRLIRARPGARLLAHTHEGCEATLILAGALRDDGVTHRRGSVSTCGPEHDHRPEIVGPEDCVCLIVISGRLRFTGPVGRVINLIAH